MNLTEARRLVAGLAGTFGATKICGHRVKIALTPDGANAALADAHHAILLGPPEVTYPTYSQAEAEWTLTLIACPPGDLLAAWAALDQLRDQIASEMGLDRVRPAEWAPDTGGVYGAYIATLTHEYNLDD